MYIRAKFATISQPTTPVTLRCPSCRLQGTFDEFPGTKDISVSTQSGANLLGQRKCPNPDCVAHIFFVLFDNKVVQSYPAERIDFDSSGIPQGIVRSLEEAITCHAHKCFIASAIMVRKCLEELCQE